MPRKKKVNQYCTVCHGQEPDVKFFSGSLVCGGCVNKKHKEKREDDNYSSSLYNKNIPDADHVFCNSVVSMSFSAH